MKQTIKKGVVLGLTFSITVLMFGLTYAAFTPVISGTVLTATLWNDLLTKVDGINTDGSGNVSFSGNIQTNGNILTDMTHTVTGLTGGNYSGVDITCTYNGTFTDCYCNDSSYQILSAGGYATYGEILRENRPASINTWRIACTNGSTNAPCVGFSAICSKIKSN